MPISPAAQKFDLFIVCSALDSSVTASTSSVLGLMLGKRQIADLNQNIAEPHAAIIAPVSMNGLIITPCSKGIYRDHAGAELSLVESVLRVCSDADEFCLAGSDGLDRSVWSALRWVGEFRLRAVLGL